MLYRRRFRFEVGNFSASALLAAMLGGCGGSGAVVSGPSAVADKIPNRVPVSTVVPLRGISDAALRAQAAAGMTLPFYTGSIKSPLDGKTYNYAIVGSDPTKSNATTTISYVPFELVVTFPDGTVLDPRQPACNDTVSVSDRFYKGPNFVKTPLSSNGVNVGKVQLGDAFQRAEFWTILLGNGYHTELKAVSSPVIVNYTPVDGTTSPGPICTETNHRIGYTSFSDFDTFIQNIAQHYAKTNQAALFLTYNIVLTNGPYEYNGYHSAFSFSGGTQVYAAAGYFDRFVVGRDISDINTWTHEIGELLNDPFGLNATPAWGHVGQVSGCQRNLEVGDPLSGGDFTLVYNNFTYHPQDLAFFSWFFRTPSTGTGGKYSFAGTFTKTQGLCT